MLQVRPTFSESWYRVVNLKARLRSSAQISRQFYRGERWYVVRDPAGNQFHRLSDAAYRFIGLLDGTRTIGQAWDLVGGQLADDAPTQPEVIQILTHLYSANLIDADITPDATVLLRRHKSLSKRKMQNRFMNILFPRIPLWDPDQFMRRWLPAVGPMISRLGALIWLVVVFSAVIAVAPMWAELKQSASHAIDPANWLWLWLVFVLIKAIHELGHAFGCRRFGGEVHELGIMFLVFIPTPYVDASTAWGFSNKWQRIFVGAAGMIVELFAASLLAFIWKYTSPDLLIHQLAYNGMLIASVSTLIFNANPLLRYDGYYILSDLLEIPNLRQKSSEYTLGLIKRHIFNVKDTQPLPPIGQRIWLLIYSVLSSIYRLFVGFVIVLIVAYRIPVLGMLMAIGGVATWAIVPLGKLIKYLTVEAELHRKRMRAAVFCAAVAAAVVVLVGLVPCWVNIDANGIVEARNHETLHAQEGGFVKQIVAHDGDLLRKGDVIMVLEAPELTANVQQLQAQKRGLDIQRQAALAEDPSQKLIVDAELKSVNHQLADGLKHVDNLTIRAPLDGRLIAPELADMAGSFLPRGQEIGTVAEMDHLVAKVALPQNDSELVGEKGTELSDENRQRPDMVQLRLVGDMGDVITARRAILIGGAQDTLPHPSLLQTGGGDIAPDPSDPKGEKPRVPQFEVRVEFDNQPDPGRQWTYYPGQRAYVRFRLEKRSLLWQWTRQLLQVLESHEHDSNLT